MDFKEGVHKSSVQKASPELEPESRHQPLRRSRRLRVLGAVLVICIIVAGIISFQIVRNQHTSSVASTHHGWCSVPVIGLRSDVGYPELKNVDMVSANDIWMAGYLVSQNSHIANQGLIEHWNGTSLTVASSPNSGENGDRFDSITEITPNNVWAVGAILSMPQNDNAYGDIIAGIHTLTEHWDGHQWSIISSPDGATEANSHNELRSIAAVSANDIWAVGDSSQNRVSNALIEHWDGSQWRIVNLPASFNGASLQEVIAPTTDDVWIAGYTYATTDQGVTPLLAHWDGQQWNLVSGLNKNFSLLSLRASSPHDIWITGEIQPAPTSVTNLQNVPGPTGLTVIARWDGTSLQQQTLPKLSLQKVSTSYGISYQDQASVFVNAANNIWVAGGEADNGLGLVATTVPAFIEHWDGRSWKAISLPQNPVGQLSVLAVTSGKVWASGTTYNGSQQTPNQLVETTC